MFILDAPAWKTKHATGLQATHMLMCTSFKLFNKHGGSSAGSFYVNLDKTVYLIKRASPTNEPGQEALFTNVVPIIVIEGPGKLFDLNI